MSNSNGTADKEHCPIEISMEMIWAAAAVLVNDTFLSISQGHAEDLATDMLTCALSRYREAPDSPNVEATDDVKVVITAEMTRASMEEFLAQRRLSDPANEVVKAIYAAMVLALAEREQRR